MNDLATKVRGRSFEGARGKINVLAFAKEMESKRQEEENKES